jgi:outer membrane protein assembly factor BamE
VPDTLNYLFACPARVARQLARRPSLSSAGKRLLPLAALIALSGCSTINNYVPSFIHPYRSDIQQGNWITQDQVDLLRPGMSREQVRFALGSPTLTSIFHADRWDYPYLFIPGNGKSEERQFTVYFANDQLVRWAGDQQPERQPFQKADTRKSMPRPANSSSPLSVDGAPPPSSLDPSATPGPMSGDGARLSVPVRRPQAPNPQGGDAAQPPDASAPPDAGTQPTISPPVTAPAGTQ